MPTIHLILNEPAWPDLATRKEVIHLQTDLQIAGLAGGMESGAPLVAIRIDLPDGRPVVAETSLVALATAVRGLITRLAPDLWAPMQPNVETRITALTALLSLMPGWRGISTSTGPDGKGGITHVASVVDFGENGQATKVVMVAQADDLGEAVRRLEDMIVANANAHEREGHDARPN